MIDCVLIANRNWRMMRKQETSLLRTNIRTEPLNPPGTCFKVRNNSSSNDLRHRYRKLGIDNPTKRETAMKRSKELIYYLRGKECRCGAKKLPRVAFCMKCYFSLPMILQIAIHRHLNDGSESAFETLSKLLDDGSKESEKESQELKVSRNETRKRLKAHRPRWYGDSE